jgi:hypothetical protein
LIFITAPDLSVVDENRFKATPTKGMFLKGTVIAVIITIPSLVAFFISWHVLGDKIMAAIVGVVVHFIGLSFSFKISKRLFKTKTA